MARPIPGDPERPLTVEQFERLPENELYRLELVRGWIVREPRPAPLHARVASILNRHLAEFVEGSGLGAVFDEMGVVLYEEPGTVRGPDLCFYVRDRIPAQGYGKGFWHVAPDLAVEILSPSNSASDILEKVTEYLDRGARLVWVVDPDSRSVTVYRSLREIQLLRGDDVLEGGDVLPGFRLPLARLFAL
ncbi:MAG: Uma2 family endonuclease [Gemmatimonadetes bacterium]|nr:Uma2 family endonuclease [Gemmatimonadota bacterium]